MSIQAPAGKRISTNYHPRDVGPGDLANSYPSLGCVSAGDRITILDFFFSNSDPLNDLTHDSSGYRPHIAYRPFYDRLTDPKDPISIAHQGFVFGNDNPPPLIRVDMTSIYCRWAGNVTIEGGKSTDGTPGDMTVVWMWDRPDSAAGIRNLTDPGGFVRHSLTFYSPGILPRIRRPQAVWDVYSPQAITLAAGLTSLALPADKRVSMGPWLEVVSGGADYVEFGILL